MFFGVESYFAVAGPLSVYVCTCRWNLELYIIGSQRSLFVGLSHYQHSVSALRQTKTILLVFVNFLFFSVLNNYYVWRSDVDKTWNPFWIAFWALIFFSENKNIKLHVTRYLCYVPLLLSHLGFLKIQHSAWKNMFPFTQHIFPFTPHICKYLFSISEGVKMQQSSKTCAVIHLTTLSHVIALSIFSLSVVKNLITL